MRPMAILSEWMLKLPIVWWISYHLRSVLCSCVKGRGEAHRCGIFVEQHVERKQEGEFRCDDGGSRWGLAGQMCISVASNIIQYLMDCGVWVCAVVIRSAGDVSVGVNIAKIGIGLGLLRLQGREGGVSAAGKHLPDATPPRPIGPVGRCATVA